MINIEKQTSKQGSVSGRRRRRDKKKYEILSGK